MTSELESFDKILGRSKNPALRQIASKENLDADYSQGIPVAKNKSTGDIVYIDFKDSTKVGLFGNSGSGKTIMGKAMVSRLHETGRTIFNGGDMDNDFQHLNHYGGVSQELVDKMGLLANEEPKEISREVYVPKPVADKSYDNLSYATKFTFGFQDINEEDLKFLVGAGDLTQSQEAVVNQILQEISLEDTSFNEIESLIEEKSENHSVESALLSKVRGLKSEDILGNRMREDPIQDLEEGKAVSIGLKGYSQFTNGGMYKLQFYSAKTFQNLMQRARSNRWDQPLVGLWPEFHRLAPAGEESLLKGHVEQFFNMMQRRVDFPFVIDSQAPSQIPNPNHSGQYNFLGKLTHVFLGCDENGRELGEQEWKTVLKSMNMLNRSNKDAWRSKMKALEPYDFLYVNPGIHSGPRDCPVVRSLAPLVSHQ